MLLLDFCFSVRKSLYGKMREMPHLEDVERCINVEVYDKDIFTKYSNEEIEKANSMIDHGRDFLLPMLVYVRL